MAGQNEFLLAMQELERLGESNGGSLHLSVIKDYFSEMGLEAQQMDAICKYLLSHQIQIKDWIAGEDTEEYQEVITVEDPLDHTMVDLYLQEAGQATILTKDQEENLLKQIAHGDQNARNELMEGYLSFAVKIAERYKGKGMQLSDLIQESNIGLMMAVSSFDATEGRDLTAYLEESIVRHLEEMIEEYNGSTRLAMKMADKINALNDMTTAFAKEYGREAKPEEVARQMGISEEEVRDLMKISLDAISVIEAN